MLKCIHCGSFNYDEARFCVNCGSRLPPSHLISRPPGARSPGSIPASRPSGAAPAAQPSASRAGTLILSPSAAPAAAPTAAGAPQPAPAGSAASHARAAAPAARVATPPAGTQGAAASARDAARGTAREAAGGTSHAPYPSVEGTELEVSVVESSAIDAWATDEEWAALVRDEEPAPAPPAKPAPAPPAKPAPATRAEVGADLADGWGAGDGWVVPDPFKSPQPARPAAAPQRAPAQAGPAPGAGPSAPPAGSMSEALMRASGAGGDLRGSAGPSAGIGRGPSEPPLPRPSSPPLRRSSAPPGSDRFPFGDLLDDLDAGFDSIIREPGAPGESGLTAGDLREVRTLFEQIAATHMRPVRDFVIELELGDPPREWVELVLPAVTSLRKSAEGMGIADLAAALDGFIRGLELVSSLGESTIGGEPKQRLLGAYAELVSTMPEAFTLGEERDRREPIIVNSLLRQVPGVRKVALDKLYAAGLTSLEMYYIAKPYDIAHAAGLNLELATHIVDKFQQYKQELAEQKPGHDRAAEYDKLGALARELREQNEAFDAASRSWSRQAAEDKKRLRKERSDTVLAINVLLARLGEVAMVNEVERLPFQRKVDELERWLEQARAARAQEAKALAAR